MNRDVTNVVVGRELVPVVDSKGDDPLRLGAADVEEELLVPGWVEVVTNDAGTEDLPAARDDNKGIHVPSSLEHCNDRRLVLRHRRCVAQ